MKFEIREAGENEWPAIKKLAAKLLQYSLPPTRKIDRARFEQSLPQVLDALEAGSKTGGRFLTLSAHEESTGSLIGYCIIMFGDLNSVLLAEQAYVLDIGVDEKYWGKYGWLPLMKEAIPRGFKSGYPIMGATITKDNLRSLRVGTHFLGFKEIGAQWVRPVAADARAGDAGGARLVAPSDAAGVARVLELARSNFPLRFASCRAEAGALVPELESRWLADASRRISDGSTVAILAGDAYALLGRELESATGEAQGVILDMSLDPRLWQSGAARNLLSKAAELCAETSLSYLVVRLPKELDLAAKAENFSFERYEIVRFPENSRGPEYEKSE